MSKREHSSDSDSSEGLGCSVKLSKSNGRNVLEGTQPLETTADEDDEIFGVSSLMHLVNSGCSTSTIDSPVQLHHLRWSSNSQPSQQSSGVVAYRPPLEVGVKSNEPSWTSELIGDDFLEDKVATQESNSNCVEDLRRILDTVTLNDDLLTQAVSVILDNESVYNKIIENIGERSKKVMRRELKNSMLVNKDKERDYLLRINPLDLCVEFQHCQKETFDLVCQVLLGVSNASSVFDNQFLLNSVCTIYSIIARIHNRNAIGYSLLLGVTARDGGLREESLKIFCLFPHIRTIQRYDKVLAKDFRCKLLDRLKEESDYFKELKQATIKFETLSVHDNSEKELNEKSELVTAKESLDEVKCKYPKLLSTVWDNLNVRSSSRYERVGDQWSDLNYDFMTSLHMLDRINVNHLDDTSKFVKKPDEMTFAPVRWN